MADKDQLIQAINSNEHMVYSGAALLLAGDIYNKAKKDATHALHQQLNSADPKVRQGALTQIVEKAAKDAPFKEEARTYELQKQYTQDLMERSYAMDKNTVGADGKSAPEGTHLEKFIAGLGETVTAQKIDFDEFQKNPLVYVSNPENQKKMPLLEKAINENAAKNIDPKLAGKPLKKDLTEMIERDEKNGKKKYDDVALGPQKPMGDGMMMLIAMIIGMLLGIDVSGFFGGQAPGQKQGQPNDLQSLQDQKPEVKVLTPEEAKKLEQLQQKNKFAGIFQDNKVDKEEFSKLLGNDKTGERGAILETLGREKEQFVILTPEAQGDNPGNQVIYAKKGPAGELTDIQVATTVKGETPDKDVTTVRKAEGSFNINDKDVGKNIIEAAKKGPEIKNSEALADDAAAVLKPALSNAVQKQKTDSISSQAM